MGRDGGASRLPGRVRDGTGVPDQRSLWMRDQKARHGEIACDDLFLLELEAP